MPTLKDHQSNEYIKLLIEGDSKPGKTGALASLVKAGYELRVLDYDNGLDVLKQFILRDSPGDLDKVEFRTLRDKRIAGPAGPKIDGTPKAFSDGIKMLDRWQYRTDDGVEIDYGVPAVWGPGVICILDSLTFFGDAAFDYREPLAPKGRDGKYDLRAVYKDAQDAVENVIALLTSEHFRTNVIVISHVKYVDNPDGSRKGYPSAIGSALSPLILRYFNNVVRFTMRGAKRSIETVSNPMFDLANAKPFEMKASYDIENGLAEIFVCLRPPPRKETTSPSKSLVVTATPTTRLVKPVRRV